MVLKKSNTTVNSGSTLRLVPEKRDRFYRHSLLHADNTLTLQLTNTTTSARDTNVPYHNNKRPTAPGGCHGDILSTLHFLANRLDWEELGDLVDLLQTEIDFTQIATAMRWNIDEILYQVSFSLNKKKRWLLADKLMGVVDIHNYMLDYHFYGENEGKTKVKTFPTELWDLVASSALYDDSEKKRTLLNRLFRKAKGEKEEEGGAYRRHRRDLVRFGLMDVLRDVELNVRDFGSPFAIPGRANGDFVKTACSARSFANRSMLPTRRDHGNQTGLDKNLKKTPLAPSARPRHARGLQRPASWKNAPKKPSRKRQRRELQQWLEQNQNRNQNQNQNRTTSDQAIQTKGESRSRKRPSEFSSILDAEFEARSRRTGQVGITVKPTPRVEARSLSKGIFINNRHDTRYDVIKSPLFRFMAICRTHQQKRRFKFHFQRDLHDNIKESIDLDQTLGLGVHTSGENDNNSMTDRHTHNMTMTSTMLKGRSYKGNLDNCDNEIITDTNEETANGVWANEEEECHSNRQNTNTITLNDFLVRGKPTLSRKKRRSAGKPMDVSSFVSISSSDGATMRTHAPNMGTTRNRIQDRPITTTINGSNDRDITMTDYHWIDSASDDWVIM